MGTPSSQGLPLKVIKVSRTHKQPFRVPLSLDKGTALQCKGPRGASRRLPGSIAMTTLPHQGGGEGGLPTPG